MKARRELTENQIFFAALLQDQTLFLQAFWKSDLTLPSSTRQKAFFNDTSQRKLLCTGRKTFKTGNLEGELIRYSINHKAAGGAIEECMLVTPGENQLSPIWDRIVHRIENNPIFSLLMRQKPKNEGKIEFHTGIVWYFRIDGSSGTDANMIGLRCKYIIGDEMALTLRVTHNSRKQSALPDCRWLYCGVPNGVRHTPFWELDQTRVGRDWSRHKFSTFVNPLYWFLKRMQQLKDDYIEGSQDYLTQVIGAWGEELFSSFPPSNMALADLPYAIARIPGADIPLEFTALDASLLMARLKLPNVPGVYQYALGMDYGYLQDPTEIVISYRMQKSREEQVDEQIQLAFSAPIVDPGKVWKLYARIELQAASPPAQSRFLQMLAGELGERNIAALCMDQAHAGIAVATDLLESDQGAWWATVLSDFNANGTVEVDVAGRGREGIEEEGPVLTVERKKKVRRKQHFTQALQLGLLAARNALPGIAAYLWLPNEDTEMTQELVDTREKKMQSGYVVYIPHTDRQNRPIDHITDALRGLMAAMLSAGAKDEQEDEDGDEDVTYESEPLFGQKLNVAGRFKALAGLLGR